MSNKMSITYQHAGSPDNQGGESPPIIKQKPLWGISNH